MIFDFPFLTALVRRGPALASAKSAAMRLTDELAAATNFHRRALDVGVASEFRNRSGLSAHLVSASDPAVN